MTPQEVAQQFGTLIAKQNFPAAWELLTEEARIVNTPEEMKAAVATMTPPGAGLIQSAQVVEEGTLESWPSQQPGDVAIVYIALNGDNFSEAVVVTVVESGCNHLIRHLEWGRP